MAEGCLRGEAVHRNPRRMFPPACFCNHRHCIAHKLLPFSQVIRRLLPAGEIPLLGVATHTSGNKRQIDALQSGKQDSGEVFPLR